MWGNTLLRATSAASHSFFISAQMNFQDRSFHFFVRKICPWATPHFLAYFSSLRHSFVGNRMVLILPFRAISATPLCAASTVMYCSSLTRIPVAQRVSNRSSSRMSPRA